MGLEEVFKRQNENQKSVSWKLEAASQLVRGNEQISLSSVHKKPVSTGEYLTCAQALLVELRHQCDYGCNTWIYISFFMQFLLMSIG